MKPVTTLWRRLYKGSKWSCWKWTAGNFELKRQLPHALAKIFNIAVYTSTIVNFKANLEAMSVTTVFSIIHVWLHHLLLQYLGSCCIDKSCMRARSHGQLINIFLLWDLLLTFNVRYNFFYNNKFYWDPIFSYVRVLYLTFNIR